MMQSDLSLLSLDEIWEELSRRYDGVILCWVKNIDSKRESSQANYSGGKFRCIGLADYCREKILKDTIKDPIIDEHLL